MLIKRDPLFGVESFFNDGFLDKMLRPLQHQAYGSMDAYKRDGHVKVSLDMPGVAAESIHVDLDGDVLTVEAERSTDVTAEDTVYATERFSGTFRRQIHLSEGLDSEGITADYSDGVLTLQIPVATKAQPRKINVGTGTVEIEN